MTCRAPTKTLKTPALFGLTFPSSKSPFINRTAPTYSNPTAAMIRDLHMSYDRVYRRRATLRLQQGASTQARTYGSRAGVRAPCRSTGGRVQRAVQAFRARPTRRVGGGRASYVFGNRRGTPLGR